jgi:hypothetical protein
LYREALFDYDEVRGLKIHHVEPEVIKDKDVVVIMNDVYVCDWRRLLTTLSSGARSLTIIASGLTLAGDVGADVIKGMTATLWVKEEGKYTSISPKSAAVYHHKDTRPWKGHHTVAFGEFKLTHKPEKVIGGARVLSTIHVSRLKASERDNFQNIPLRAPLPGALIEKGKVPLLCSVDWEPHLTGTDRDYVAIKRVADRLVEDVYGDIKSNMNVKIGGETILTRYHKARKSTIDKGISEVESISISKPNPAADQRESDFAKRASVLGPFAATVATLRAKRPYLETSVRFATESAALIKRAISKLVEAIKKLFKLLWNYRHDDKGKEEEVSPLQPTHVLYHAQQLLSKGSKFLMGSSNKKVVRVGNTLRWFSKLMGRPFDADTFLPLLGELLMTLGVVVAERAIGTLTGGLSEVFICAVEVVNIMLMDGPVGARLLASGLNICVHLFNIFVPWWVSLPIQVVLDIFGTGLFLKGVQKVRSYLQQKGLLTDEIIEGWERITSLFRESKKAVFMHDNVYVEDGAIHFSDFEFWEVVPSRPIDEAVLPADSVEKLHKNPAVNLKIKVNGKRVRIDELGPHLKNVKPKPKAVCVPLIDMPLLRGFALTTSHPIVFLSAAVMRYHTIEPFKGDNRTIIPLLDRLLQDCPPFHRMSDADFIAHAHECWDKTKVFAYQEALDEEPHVLTKPIKEVSGKSNELLRWRDGSHVKCRVVYPYKPADHVRYHSIHWALQIKKIVIAHVNLSVLEGGGKPPLHMYIPVKGTAMEIAERINSQERKSMLSLLSGDDSYDCYRSASGKVGTNAADLRSCDTTLGELVRPVLQALVARGMPHQVEDHILDLCSGKFKWKSHQKHRDGGDIVFSGTLWVEMLNGSGNPLTTLLTLLVNCSLRVLTWQMWNGDPSHWRVSLGQGAKLLGVDIEFEEHGYSGMNPIGRDTFLSCVPIKTATTVVVIPKGHIKALVVKGEKEHFKGFSLLCGIAARANDPALSTTHYGTAIRDSYRRYLHGKPVPLGQPSPKNPYKLAFEESARPLLTLEEEATYYSQFGDFDVRDLGEELGVWQRGDLPYHGQRFPILEAIAKAHYSLS